MEAHSGREMWSGTSRRGDIGYAFNGLYIDKAKTLINSHYVFVVDGAI